MKSCAPRFSGPGPQNQSRLRWSPTALRPWHLSTRFGGRNPPTFVGRSRLRTAKAEAHPPSPRLRGVYPLRVHPRVYTRGFLRRRVNKSVNHFGIQNGIPVISTIQIEASFVEKPETLWY